MCIDSDCSISAVGNVQGFLVLKRCFETTSVSLIYYVFFSSIFITFLTLGIFSSIIESKHGVLSLLKIDLCYKFDFNLWQPDCQVILC